MTQPLSEQFPAAAGYPERQRIGAYAVLTRGTDEETEILLTQMSARTPIEGLWGLPGGGIDHGEHPREAVVREVYEETGLHVEPGAVLDVSSVHFQGPRPDGLVEDYHGLHIIYAATILPESVGVAPRVIERGGSTELAAWIDVVAARSLRLLGVTSHALELIA
ncbi:MAG: NUDIX domain-containing protein [Nocardioidaceae bacterium]